MNIIDNIEINKSNFTKAELKFYELLKENIKYVESHSIVMVAKKCGASKSAILRFCQKIGYSGYSEFRFDLMKYTHSQIKTNNDISILNITTSLFNKVIDNMKNIDENLIKRCVKKIYDSNIIKVIGVMDSSLVAKKFFYDFTKLGKNVFAITDIMEINFAMNSMLNNDLLILFSVDGYLNNLEDFFIEIKEKNMDLILITCNKNAKFIKYSSEHIVISCEDNSMIIDEHVLLFVFLNILIEYYKEYM
ncbi:MurR/RpiR family transcriptional regulator [Brachyspira intermedia]|uniref:MurR/RpiR family transcriptional regulator n=1 Tax=Brachyspira intermedia TaxID=84377 RepID=UPI003004BF6D